MVATVKVVRAGQRAGRASLEATVAVRAALQSKATPAVLSERVQPECQTQIEQRRRCQLGG